LAEEDGFGFTVGLAVVCGLTFCGDDADVCDGDGDDDTGVVDLYVVLDGLIAGLDVDSAALVVELDGRGVV
jgi:hypothetical protein